MNMTAEEIVRHYRLAKDKKGDIQVLADLNGTDKASIRAVLIDAGELQPDKAAGKKKPVGKQMTAAVDALLTKGKSKTEIMQELGCMEATVEKRMAVRAEGKAPAEQSRAEQSRAERPAIRREKGKPHINVRIAAIIDAVPEEAPDCVKARAVDLCKSMMAHAEL